MQPKLYILTGNIQTGKTTALLNWCKNRNDVSGLATPIINGKRCFYNILTAGSFAMEATENESNTLAIGRFIFCQAAFNKANTILQQATNSQFIVVDEIGPLELNQQGLYQSVLYLLKENKSNLLLVVREKLVPLVIDYFKLQQVTILTVDDLQKLER
jgi:nucleoside-triphosphatase